jgi:peptidyl-prolyl cis-trans isomerase SurA
MTAYHLPSLRSTANAVVIGASILILPAVFAPKIADAAKKVEKRVAEPPAQIEGNTHSEKIVAVVNDEAISEGDMNARINLAILAGNYPNTAETREALTPQVLRTLIDDQLRLQEAKRLKVTVDKEEIDAELKNSAENNKQTLQQLEELFAKAGVPLRTYERQLTAQLAWRKIIQKEIRRRVEVTDQEIDTAYAKVLSSVNKPQYLLAEIFLSVDSPADDAKVKAFADQLEDQIHQGASFAKLSQQFSQAAGAAQSGDLGAVQEGELSEEIDEAIKKVAPGQITPPIRTQAGYHIILVRSKGSALAGDPTQAMVHLKNVLVPFPYQPTKDNIQQLIDNAKKVGEGLSSCAAVDEKGRRDGLAGDVGSPTQMTKVSDLPPAYGPAVAGLQVNQISPPIVTNDGLMLFMVCARKDPPKRPPPTREQVGNQIYMERLDQQQQRYLSDLRASGFIDVRV